MFLSEDEGYTLPRVDGLGTLVQRKMSLKENFDSNAR
jgi:hypothetical protein